MGQTMLLSANLCITERPTFVRSHRTLRHLDQLREHLTSAVSEPVLRDALTRLWYVNDQMQQAQGDACVRLRQFVVIEQVLCARLCPQWQSAYRLGGCAPTARGTGQ